MSVPKKKPSLWAPTMCHVCGKTFDARKIAAHLASHGAKS